MKLFLKAFMTTTFISTLTLSAADVNVYKATDSKAINDKTVSAMYQSLGSEVTSVSKLKKKFKKVFGDTTFDKFSIMATYNPSIAQQLIEKYPEAGAFIPYSVVLQSYADNNDVTFTTLNTDTMKKVLGIQGEEKLFNKLAKKNSAVIGALGFDATKAVEPKYSVAKAEGPLLYKKEVSAKEAAPLVEKFLGIMRKHKFTILNDLNILDELDDLEEKYDYYHTFSICKVKVLYLASKTRPEAAAFAPCSLAVYKAKGSDKVTFVFPSTYNWLSSLHMEDPKAVKILKDEQKEIEGFIESL